MAALCYSLAFALILLQIGEAVTGPECQSKDGEIVCSVPSPPQRVLLLRDRLIVGAIDNVYSFSPDLKLLEVGDASPSDTRKKQCVDVEAHQASLCRNFVRVVEQVNASSLLVCGTNAVFPKCRFVQMDNLSAWEYMTADGEKDVGFSPHSDDANVAILADNGAFLTATFFNFRQTQQTIGLSPSLLGGETQITVQTPSFSPDWLNDPVFVSAYEVGEHVYFFARERAYELASGVELSRAIRVCKNDTGFLRFSGDSIRTFRTFQKARLRCTATGHDGSIPYDYDRLQATFLYHPNDGSAPTLYATFSSAVNGPEGSALCKFNFADLESVFDSGEYLVLEEKVWRVDNGGSFVCPGNEGQQRTDEQAKTHQLVSGVISATEPQPMVTVLGNELLFLVADVVQFSGSELEVVFAALGGGQILQVAWYEGSRYENMIKNLRGVVTNMVLHKEQQTQERRVLLTTNGSVQSVTLGKCGKYETCFDCFDSHDPYCGWSEGTAECVNKLTSTSPLLDSLTSSEETVTGVCGPRSATPPPPSPTNPTSCPFNTDSSEPPTSATSASEETTPPSETTASASSPIEPTPAGLAKTSEERGENAGLLAGATVGGFLFGIPVGLVVCYLFFTVFLKRGKAQESSQNSVHLNPSQSERNEKQPLPNGSHRLELTSHIVHRNPTSSKNVNQREEDDVLTPLPFSKGNSYIQHTSVCSQLPPGYQAPPGSKSSEMDGTLVSPV